MLINLHNIIYTLFKALSHIHIAGVLGWSDSTVCLESIQGYERYKRFVANRVEDIYEKEEIVRNYGSVKRIQQISAAGEHLHGN